MWWTQEGKGCSSSSAQNKNLLPTSGTAALQALEEGINAVLKTQKHKEGNKEREGVLCQQAGAIPARIPPPARSQAGQAHSQCHNIPQWPVPAAQVDICTLAFQNTFPWPAPRSPCRQGHSQGSSSGSPQNQSPELQHSSPTSELLQNMTG